MGYTTEFEGEFQLNKKLDDELHTFLKKFSETRRVKRKLPPEYGVEGEFFVEGLGYRGQDPDHSVVDGNNPPRTQPSLWCGWIPSDDGMTIQWDGGEKFYSYHEWIVYVVQNFLAPKGYELRGSVAYQGEEETDYGTLIMTNNVLYIAVQDRPVLDLYVPKLCRSQLDHHAETVLLNDGGEVKLLEGKTQEDEGKDQAGSPREAAGSTFEQGAQVEEGLQKE